MQARQSLVGTSPHCYTAKIKGTLSELITQLHQGMHDVNEPKAQALFETSAEVLKGLLTAYIHYEHQSGQP